MSVLNRWPIFVVCLVLAAGGAALVRYVLFPNDVNPDPPSSPAYLGGGRPKDRPPLIPDTNLTLVATEADLADPARPVDPVVYVEPPDMYDTNSQFPQVTGLLRRELYRQGVMLAAREELGLTLRDALLGEEPPADLAANNRLRVNPRFPLGKKADVRVECGPPAASRLVWRAAGVEDAGKDETPLEALTAAESLSRDGFVTALKRAGLRGTATRQDPAAAVPAAVEDRVGKMTFPGQFAALRDLHALVREKGESPASITALVRAYANLGTLTDRQWDSMTWVFKARALLYAERLRRRDPKAPWGHWARAYAAALVGLHKVALDDLAEAEKVRGEVAVPAWASLAEALCRFDTAGLKAVAAAGGPLADAAGLFQFLTVENPSAAPRMFAVGADVLARNPECYRVHDTVQEYLRVGMPYPAKESGFDTLTRTFPERVREMPGLPAAVADKATADAPEAELVKALAEAGRSREDLEPTWAALGRFARETRAVQVSRRLEFLHFNLAVSAADEFERLRPLVADHPLAAFLEALGVDRGADPDGYERRLRTLKVPDLNYRHGQLLYSLQRLGPTASARYSNIAFSHGDRLYYDIYLSIRWMSKGVSFSVMGLEVLTISPYAPLARAALIRDDWKTFGPRAAQWEKEAQHPEVFLALARQSIAQNRPADAERQAAEAVKLAPGLEAYQVLAQARLAAGPEDRFVTTLEEFLKVPDQGLAHARARADIADYYLARKQADKARPYAEAAAATGSAWGMDTAARCAEGRGDWAEAEQLIRQVVDRYGDCRTYWYAWCLRTGRGDLAAARAQAEAHLNAVGPPRDQADLMLTGLGHSAAGKPATAAVFYKMLHGVHRHDLYLLTAAAEFDAGGDARQRDLALQEVSTFGPYQPIVAFIRTRLAAGPEAVPGKEDVETALKPLPSGPVHDAYYLVGRFLQNRGKPELAAEYLRRATSHLPSSGALAPVLAALALREIEKK